MKIATSLLLLLALAVTTAPVLRAAAATAPAALAERAPVAPAQIIPDKFLRRWDPVTLFFANPVGPAQGGAERQPQRFVTLSPAHPGAYTWLDAKTLQFRPAEPWPALSRFTFSQGGQRRGLVTLMEAPLRSVPADGEAGLDPVDRITLTFAEPLDATALRRMLRIGLRPLPGIDEGQTRWLDEKDFSVKVVERSQRQDPASYVLNLRQPIPTGQRVILRLRLAEDDASGETFKDIAFSTAEPFRMTAAGCAGMRLPLAPEGVRYARDQVLTCNEDQRQVRVEFSAPPRGLGTIPARNLLRFTPAVEGLSFRNEGSALVAEGRFQANTLYRLDIRPIALSDLRGRPLAAKASSELYLHFPAKPRYLDWQVGHGIVERYGPQQVPLAGRGFGRVDLRVYSVDPLNRSFWPFPEKAVAVDEQAAPPAPGEEPAGHADAGSHIDAAALARHLRTLGSPPVSTLVKLPLGVSGGAARFGLDLAPHFARLAGAQQPGTYLVGIRRIDESTQRHWVRVQVTDLSLSTVDEEDGVKFAVTSLASGVPVAGAEISVEGVVKGKWAILLRAATGADGTYRWQAPGMGKHGASVRRIVVRQGRDVLVLDPTRAPDRYGDNTWREAGDTWLQWTQEPLSGRAEPPVRLCHVFTERPVYRPEEKVYIKGYARQRHRGGLSLVGGGGTVVVQGPGDLAWRYPVKFSAQGSFDLVFAEAAAPTGPYRVRLELAEGQECAGVDILKEAYRAPEFDLRLSAPDQVALDREFKIQLAAQYYAGGQVIDRPVRWRVTQFPYTWTPKTLPGFFFSSDGRFSGRERFQASPTLMREDKTDADGGATLALNPAIEPSAQPRSYVVEATVTGADDQTVTATQRVLALPAVVLGIKAPRYLERAASVTPSIVALGPDGKPVAGQEVTVRLIRREWHAHLQAGDFSRAEAKYVSEVVDNKLLEKKVVSGREPMPIKLDLEGAGVYLIELETRDRLGRPQRVAVDFFAGGDQPVSWSRPPSEVFNATPDKPAYNPGETAHLILESPFQQAQGLAIIEAPEGNRYQWFNVRNGSAAFDMAVLKQYVPRVPVHFVLMRGRVPGVQPAPGTRLDLGKPATVAATAWLKVQPVEHQVTVTLDNPAKARPGETVDVRIRLADRAGKPLAGEVTLWLVDQAVLALGKEQRLDPLPDFITPVQSRLSLQDTRNWTLGLLPLDELPGGDAGKKEATDDLLDKVTLRRDFQPVPYFNPNIQVGGGGETVVRVKLPDNLTNFKLRAKVASGADRFGVATGQVSVRMPLIVQPALPRFVRPGDRFTATAIGRVVEGPAGAATARVRAKGVEVAGETSRRLDLKLGIPQRIEFPVSVPQPTAAPTETGGETVRFSVAVERAADQARDGFEVDLPVRPDRSPVLRRQLLELKPGQRAELPAVAEPVRAGSLRRSLLVSDQPALVRMAAGLEFLMDYPHGCTEQRISRARALVALRDFNQRLKREGQERTLKPVVADMMKWLPGVVDENGLAAYWPGSRGYVSLTAWVTEFLVEARGAGFTVDTALLDRLTGSLRQSLRSDYTHFITGEAYTERVMALRALAAAGKSDSAYLAELARRADSLNLESGAEILRLLRVSGSVPAATTELAKRVNDGVVTRLHQGREIYGGLQDTAQARNGLILPSETRTLAEIARAASAAAKADPRLPVLVDALVTLGQGDGWGSTQANTAALMALSDQLKGRPDGAVQTLDVDAGGQVRRLIVGGKEPVVTTAIPSPAVVGLSVGGDGPLVVRAETRYLPQALGSQAAAGASGFVVARESLRLKGGAPPERVRFNEPGIALRLQVGDVVEEHVEVVSNNRHNHVAVVVPLAAGLEPLNPGLATSPPEAKPSGSLTRAPSYVAYMDDQVAFYYDELDKGTYHFYFRTRATVPGQYTQPQARAELMYDGAVHGESVGARVEIGAADR